MRYCPTCLQEYQDDVKTCSDCGGQPLVSEEELARRPEFRRIREDEDTTAFGVVDTAEDPFEADAFTAAIHDAGIQVLARMRRAGTAEIITTGVQHPWWEILVPEPDLAKARQIVEARRRELAEVEPEAEKEAEADELESETTGAKPE